MRIQNVSANYQQNKPKTSFGMLEMSPETYSRLKTQMRFSKYSAYSILDPDFLGIMRTRGVDIKEFEAAAKTMPNLYVELSDIIAALKSENPIKTLKTRKATKITNNMIEAELSALQKRSKNIKNDFPDSFTRSYFELGEYTKIFKNLGIENESIPYGSLSNKAGQQTYLKLRSEYERRMKIVDEQ